MKRKGLLENDDIICLLSGKKKIRYIAMSFFFLFQCFCSQFLYVARW